MRTNRLDSSLLGGGMSAAIVALALLGLTLAAAPSARAAGSGEEIDATVWNVISATVADGDVDGMAAVYHADAVLVSPKGTLAIADQLVEWGEEMERQRREGRKASVSFRFTSRQDDAGTAFERGIFRYAETDENGVEEPVFIAFEALLVKKGGRWLVVMERQLEGTDESAWRALDGTVAADEGLAGRGSSLARRSRPAGATAVRRPGGARAALDAG